MASFLSRRKYVQLLGVSAAVGVAGCTDSSDDTGANGGSDEQSGGGEEDAGDDEAAGNGENGSAENGSTEEGTDNSEADEEADDSDDGETEEEEEAATDEEGEEEGGEEEAGNPRLRDVFNWSDSYIMELTSADGEGRSVYYRGDSHTTWSMGDSQFESYRIGDEYYSIFDGECYMFESEPEEEEFDPEEPVEDDVEYYATGTTTIEGQEVYEFDLGDGLYYLSVSTGYPVRYVGSEGAVVNFHSWGETNPISPPEMDCLSI